MHRVEEDRSIGGQRREGRGKEDALTFTGPSPRLSERVPPQAAAGDEGRDERNYRGAERALSRAAVEEVLC